MSARPEYRSWTARQSRTPHPVLATDEPERRLPARRDREGDTCAPGWKPALRRLLVAFLFMLLAVAVLSHAAPRATAQVLDAPPGATIPAKCIVCGKGPLVGRVWKHRHGMVCDDCHDLDMRCTACGLPLKEPGGRSGDGRVFCKIDFPNIVLKQDEARRIYDDTVLDLRRIHGSYIELRFTNVNVQLFDVDYWNHRDGKPLPAPMRRGGFSQTTSAGRQLTHNVLLLSGQTRTDMASTCAHEFTHLWLNENVPDTRIIETHTIEAICELVAFKLATARRDGDLQDRIRRNTYTAGRIEKLIEADQRHGIKAILDWARHGTNDTVDDRSLAAFGSKPSPPPPPAIRSPTAGIPIVPPPVKPAQPLQLVGLMINPKRRAAQVNDHLFEVNDEKRMMLGDRIVAVRCIEIRTNAVVLSLDGSTNHVTLWRVGR